MVKKKTKIDDLEDFEMEEDEIPEVVEEVEEVKQVSQEDVINNFIKVIDDKLERLTIAISTNQKYIKELYASQKLLEERQERLQDNFNILLKEEK